MKYCISDLNYKKANLHKLFFMMPDCVLPLLSQIKLKPRDRLMYIALFQHSNTETGLCYPSRKRLMECTGLSQEKSVTASIQRLIEVGLVEIIEKGYYDLETGINKANTYKVKFIYPSDWVQCHYDPSQENENKIKSIPQKDLEEERKPDILDRLVL